MCRGAVPDSVAATGADADVAGEAREVCFAYLPEAQVGDYVLIQNGFAMNLLTPQEAQESWETWAELGVEAR